ncbi:CatB-related O-acetyltransferase [Chitinivorax sp. PXF-14]|uniref:CatB-related O-acetyltransferase n=1 Tax=Chitinivorax sp. PXF-14 TaxID=3230488 RepID=UPI00346581A4
MKLQPDDGYIGLAENHEWSKRFMVLQFEGGGISLIPHGFFTTWLDAEPNFGSCPFGRCSGFGTGSRVKYDNDQQKLVVGRFVSAGQNVKIVLNGQHEIRTISSYLFGLAGLQQSNVPILGDVVLGNDLWIGDEAMILGGANIGSGCVVGARALVTQNQVLEPYGIYAGTPARLVRFRFSERVRELLLQLQWWDKPLSWVKQHNDKFLTFLTEDEGRAIEILNELIASKHSAQSPYASLSQFGFRQTWKG